MPRSAKTSALSRHLWNDHKRTKSEGTHDERMLLHEELHATADPAELNHEHGEDGSYIAKCPGCGYHHICTALSISGE